MKVLVINCGSSTIKYQLIDMAKMRLSQREDVIKLVMRIPI